MRAEGEVSDKWLHSALATYCQVLVELVQNKTHAVHEAVHVRRLALLVGRASVRGKRGLERFEVLHPLERELVWLDVGFVEYEDEGEFCFVEDTVAKVKVTFISH